MAEFTVGSLFTGIGMIDYAFEQVVRPDGRKGFKVLWQVENDDFCIRVLEKHWPGLHRVGDVRDASAANLSPVDALVGGFPCQDISNAGKGEGIKEGNRSGLWFEFARIIGELRPRYVFLENVPPVTTRGGTTVLAQLAEMGFDAEWGVIPASAVGAPHRRERWYCVAYAQRPERRQGDPAGRRVAHDDDSLQERQEDAGRAGVGSETLADAARFSQPDQPEVAGLQPTVGSAVAGAGSGIVSGDTAEGVRVGGRTTASSTEDVAYTEHERRIGGRAHPTGRSTDHRTERIAQEDNGGRSELVCGIGKGSIDVGNPTSRGTQSIQQPGSGNGVKPTGQGVGLADAFSTRLEVGQGIGGDPPPQQQATERADDLLHWWTTQSCVCRAVDGLSSRMDRSRWPAPPGSPQHPWEAPRILRSRQPDRAKRLKALGNSVVWQVVAPFAEAIWWALEEERLNG